MAWVMYDLFLQGQHDSSSQPGAPIDFNAASPPMVLLLVDSTNAPARATDADIADAIAGSTEVTGTNYARKTLSSVTVVLSSNTVTIGASDPAAYAQSSAGFSDARYAIIAVDPGADASSPLVCYADLAANKNNKSGSLTLQLSSGEIFSVAGSA
jgi:hypothetical protein